MEWFTAPEYWFSRLVLERGIAGVYLIAFICAASNSAPSSARRACCRFAVSVCCVVPAGAQHLSLALLGQVLRDRRVVGCRAQHCTGRGHRRPRAAVGGDARVAAVVDAVPVDRQCRAAVIRLRLGTPAAGGRLSGGAPRQRQCCAAGAGHLAGAVAGFPYRSSVRDSSNFVVTGAGAI